MNIDFITGTILQYAFGCGLSALVSIGVVLEKSGLTLFPAYFPFFSAALYAANHAVLKKEKTALFMFLVNAVPCAAFFVLMLIFDRPSSVPGALILLLFIASSGVMALQTAVNPPGSFRLLHTMDACAAFFLILIVLLSFGKPCASACVYMASAAALCLWGLLIRKKNMNAGSFIVLPALALSAALLFSLTGAKKLGGALTAVWALIKAFIKSVIDLLGKLIERLGSLIPAGDMEIKAEPFEGFSIAAEGAAPAENSAAGAMLLWALAIVLAAALCFFLIKFGKRKIKINLRSSDIQAGRGASFLSFFRELFSGIKERIALAKKKRAALMRLGNSPLSAYYRIEKLLSKTKYKRLEKESARVWLCRLCLMLPEGCGAEKKLRALIPELDLAFYSNRKPAAFDRSGLCAELYVRLFISGFTGSRRSSRTSKEER